MRRSPSLLLVLVLVVAVALWTGSQRPAAPFAVSGETTASAGPFRVQAVASCASMACHHFNGSKGDWRSEYSTWIGHDPHARAYEVLFDKRSKQMVKNLYGHKTLDDAHPERDKLCLS